MIVISIPGLIVLFCGKLEEIFSRSPTRMETRAQSVRDEDILSMQPNSFRGVGVSSSSFL